MRQYFGIENLALTAAQLKLVTDELETLGRDNQSPQPAERNHWRVNLAKTAVIFEADWNLTDWTLESFKGRIARIANTAVSNLTTSAVVTAYGEETTIKISGTNRIKLIAFGGVDATYQESLSGVQAYLKANLSSWESIS